MSVRIERLVIRAETQIFGGQIRIDHFVRIQPILRIPGSFEFT